MIEQSFFLLISVLIILAYVGFILWLVFIFILKQKKQRQAYFEPFISLVIIFRNEEKALPLLLQSILKQDYPKSKMEIIFVDDSSNDNSLSLVRTFQKNQREYPVKIFELDKEKNNALGKKEALTLAYSKAEGDYILLTDADCQFDTKNIRSRIQSFQNPRIKVVSAAVLINKEKTIFSLSQSLENLSLIATTAATTAANIPILSNGANLAFERKSFLKLSADALLKEENSGDDLFLLHSFKKHFGAKSIAFEFDNDSIVYTQAQPNIKSFFNQRKRWLSKSKSFKDFWLITISLLVLIVNINILIAAIACIFNAKYLIVFLFLFGLKFCVDFFFLSIVAQWYKQKYLLWVYPLVQLFYPLFVVISNLFALFFSYEWKGRKY